LTPLAFGVTIGDMKDGGLQAGKRPYRMTARADAARATAMRVLDEAVELFTDNAYEDVSLEEVAERAQVTKRTVLRRFGSKDELFVAAMDQAVEEMITHRDAAPVGDVAGAVANVVEHYERWGANRLRLLSEEDRIPIVAENVQGGRRYHWSWVERTFAPLIDGRKGAARKRRIAALVALTDVYTWKLLRRDLGLSRPDTERTLVELIEKLEGES
jgi:AcrR family transcriptional regulator